jgi:hypothetical protein
VFEYRRNVAEVELDQNRALELELKPPDRLNLVPPRFTPKTVKVLLAALLAL